MTDIDLTDTSAGISTPNDRDKLKIASFRTKEGVWADFTAEANKRGLTATDILKIAMEQFINGEYTPTINTGVHTLVRTQPSITRDEIQELIDTAVSTAISTETIAANIMTVISTLSLLTNQDVSTAINTALVPLTDEISEVAEFSRNLQGEIAKVKKSLSVGVASPMENRVESSKTIEAKPARKSPESLDLKTATDASWGAFHQILGLDCPPSSKKSVELGAIATDRATEMGFVGWTFDGKKQRFYRP